MSRLIFVPQYPSKLRYQEFFITEFPKKLSKYYDDIVILGSKFIKNASYDKSDFSPLKESILMEQIQIAEYLDLTLKDDDTLLVMDLSYPGIFCNALYHKPIQNAFVYCHATSKNNLDYFEKVRESKFLCETSHSKLFKKVFVGTNYHKQKLGWDNIEVIGLPIPPFKTYQEEKKYDIISVCRPNLQKVTKSIEDIIERDYCDIKRKEVKTWEEYYKFLSQGKILLITSKEETFGYQVLEAILNGTIVLAPNRCSYPELLHSDYIYTDIDDLKNRLTYYLNRSISEVKPLLNFSNVYHFYKNLALQMKKE